MDVVFKCLLFFSLCAYSLAYTNGELKPAILITNEEMGKRGNISFVAKKILFTEIDCKTEPSQCQLDKQQADVEISNLKKEVELLKDEVQSLVLSSNGLLPSMFKLNFP